MNEIINESVNLKLAHFLIIDSFSFLKFTIDNKKTVEKEVKTKNRYWR